MTFQSSLQCSGFLGLNGESKTQSFRISDGEILGAKVNYNISSSSILGVSGGCIMQGNLKDWNVDHCVVIKVWVGMGNDITYKLKVKVRTVS